MESVDLVIVGAGPAGLSTAMHLQRRDPAWSDRMVVLEKDSHPRPKACGGGITRFGLTQLHSLGLTLGVPFVPVETAEIRYHEQRFHIRGSPAFVVTRRPEFDAWLADSARARGIRILENTAVMQIQPTEGGMRVDTANGRFTAKVVVGADGSRGKLRTWVAGRPRPPHVARLLEVIVPVTGAEPEFSQRIAHFDFSPADSGLQGYYWRFPSFIESKPHMNSGVFDARIHARRRPAALPGLLERSMDDHQDDSPAEVKGHPIHWYSPRNRLAKDHVLLVGDAAGADPLLGEGISIALAYGAVAAETIQGAFAGDDFRFKGYRRRVVVSPLGRYLLIRWLVANIAYRLSHRDLIMRLIWHLGAGIVGLLGSSHARPTLEELLPGKDSRAPDKVVENDLMNRLIHRRRSP